MTAVEFIAQELSKKIDNNLFMEVAFNKLLEQAKEMEKEQMKALYTMHIVDTRTMELYDFEEYYNETFKTE